MPDKIKLLVVDDEKPFLDTICKLLKARYFDVTPVSSGEEAIEAARKKEFEIAIVDLKMPDMDGLQVLEALKKEHRFMEVIILTGQGSSDYAIRCTMSGVYRYVYKPCELDILLNILKEAYQQRIKNKYGYKDEEIKGILSVITPDSPLEILRKLKKIDKD